MSDDQGTIWTINNNPVALPLLPREPDTSIWTNLVTQLQKEGRDCRIQTGIITGLSQGRDIGCIRKENTNIRTCYFHITKQNTANSGHNKSISNNATSNQVNLVTAKGSFSIKPTLFWLLHITPELRVNLNYLQRYYNLTFEHHSNPILFRFTYFPTGHHSISIVYHFTYFPPSFYLPWIIWSTRQHNLQWLVMDLLHSDYSNMFIWVVSETFFATKTTCWGSLVLFLIKFGSCLPNL